MAGTSFTVEAFTLLGVALVIICFRLSARAFMAGFPGLQPDDYLMILVGVAYSLETICGNNIGARWHGLANSGMTGEQRAALDLDSDEWAWREGGAKNQLMGWSAYCFTLWCLKAAMCTFYLRLTDGLKHYRRPIYVGFVLIAVTWVATTCTVLFTCRPFPKNWQVYPDPGNLCQPAVSRANLFTMVVLNGGTDLYLLLIPMPMLWAAQIPVQKKIGLIGIFSGSILVTTAGLLRCVSVIKDPIEGAEESVRWACRESFVAVVTTNVPMIYPLLQRLLSPILGSIISSVGSKYQISKHSANPQPRPILLEDAKLHSNLFLKRARGSSSLAFCSANMTHGGSQECLHEGVGIRKHMEVRVVETLADLYEIEPNTPHTVRDESWIQDGSSHV